MVPVGEGPRNHPHLASLNLPPLGMETRGNPLVTRTLLFIAQGGGNVGAAPPAAGSGIKLPPPETRKLYAFDKATGRQLWATAPPIAGPMASPMTYLHQGRQYLVVAAGAGLTTGLVAYALPSRASGIELAGERRWPCRALATSAALAVRACRRVLKAGTCSCQGAGTRGQCWWWVIAEVPARPR